jgi:hypothetical protein
MQKKILQFSEISAFSRFRSFPSFFLTHVGESESVGCVHCFFSDVGNYVSTAQLRGHLLRALGGFYHSFFFIAKKRMIGVGK